MELTAKTREIFGKKANEMRNQGLIPAELYGHGVSNRHLSLSAKDFSKVYKEAGESVVVNLDLDGEKLPVLIHEVSSDPVKNHVLHVDFYQVNMKEKTTTSVPLEFIGVSPAVKEKKGVLVKAMQEMEVEALPANLPSKIEVDISAINEIGESIYVKDLKAIDGVEFLAEGESVVATVSEQAKEEEIPSGPESVEEVKVEGEDKKPEEKSEENKKEN
jgi:large subunit ribosomal protein L25